MQRCLELARLGLGNTAPNPMVGCVIVHEGKIIGEGYHEQCGQAHAEPNAIKSVTDKSLLSKSTLYVSLEPCAHYGKTPPCANLIIENNIPQVIIGCRDSYHEVAGRGIELLAQHGIDVTVGILENECRNLNKRFFTSIEKQRPYVILKWAQTADGFIWSEQDRYITCDESNILVHKWRSEEQAILVGTNTVKKDNPSLTTRLWKGKNPARVIIDNKLELNNGFSVFNDNAQTIVFTNNPNIPQHAENIRYVVLENTSPENILHELYLHKIQSVIIEGGAKLLTSFINKGIWDEARVFTAIKKFEQGIKSPLFNFEATETTKVGGDILKIYYRRYD